MTEMLKMDSDQRERVLIWGGFAMLGISLLALIGLFHRVSCEKSSEMPGETELDRALDETFPASDPVTHY